MTTENGLTRPAVARANIQRLQRRADWLEGRIRERFDEGYEPTHPNIVFDEKELAALEWAIPILEADYDATVRVMRTIVEHAHPRAKNIDRLVESGAWK